MSTKRKAARASEALPASPARRRFTVGSAAALTRAASPLAAAWSTPAFALPDATQKLLAESEFVYVSPLLADGRESTCHGEVWYGWFDGDVVLITATSTWKGRAIAKGLDRARIWVGNHGRWKQWLGLTRNEAFRSAPSFDARARVVQDEALLDALMLLFRKKYPAEVADWEPAMRAGFADGSRWLLRYTPETG